MDTKILERHFARMGARLKVTVRGSGGRLDVRGFRVDVGRDARGPFFDVTLGADAGQDVEVLDVQPRQRHLLLMVRQTVGNRREKHKFLCGHDERDWFAAAVPEASGVGTVSSAMEALKPGPVRAAQARAGLKRRDRNRRRNRAFLRQGEWFFIPQPDMVVPADRTLRNEPLVRGRGKPHVAEWAYRTGGETVYVCRDCPRGLTEPESKALLARKPSAKRLPWTTMRRNAGVYVRGKIRHPDHKTITLHGWHQVLPNTESQAPSMRHLAFLD